ncbi:hypothetical protein DESC_910019 [Desulfosarcina cetonica]|nr:hypothetical protein DESC_910019 [Desulfosarcina cetonica]
MFQRLDFRRVAAQLENRPGSLGRRREDDGGQQGEIDPLPDAGADAGEISRTGILGHENAQVAGDSGKEGQDEKSGHAGRQGCGNGIEGIVGQKDPVGEFHDRGGRHGENQGQADGKKITIMMEAMAHGGFVFPATLTSAFFNLS